MTGFKFVTVKGSGHMVSLFSSFEDHNVDCNSFLHIFRYLSTSLSRHLPCFSTSLGMNDSDVVHASQSSLNTSVSVS